MHGGGKGGLCACQISPLMAMLVTTPYQELVFAAAPLSQMGLYVMFSKVHQKQLPTTDKRNACRATTLTPRIVSITQSRLVTC